MTINDFNDKLRYGSLRQSARAPERDVVFHGCIHAVGGGVQFLDVRRARPFSGRRRRQSGKWVSRPFGRPRDPRGLHNRRWRRKRSWRFLRCSLLRARQNVLLAAESLHVVWNILVEHESEAFSWHVSAFAPAMDFSCFGEYSAGGSHSGSVCLQPTRPLPEGRGRRGFVFICLSMRGFSRYRIPTF